MTIEERERSKIMDCEDVKITENDSNIAAASDSVTNI